MGKVIISPPSEYILDYLENWGISIQEFIENIDLEKSKVVAVLNNASPITKEVAIALSTYTKCSVESWLGIQRAYDDDMKGIKHKCISVVHNESEVQLSTIN